MAANLLFPTLFPFFIIFLHNNLLIFNFYSFTFADFLSIVIRIPQGIVEPVIPCTHPLTVCFLFHLITQILK